jgi:xanthosine utilization system XapX-like protein
MLEALSVPVPIQVAVVSIIGVYIGGVLLFRILSNKEDEKR